MRKWISLCLIMAVLAGMMTSHVGALTDSKGTIDLNTGEFLDFEWGKRVNLMECEHINIPDEYGNRTSDIVVTKNADGSVTYGTTNGMCPAFVYEFSGPISASASLELDFDVAEGSSVAIYAYFGPSDHTNINRGSYMYVQEWNMTYTGESELSQGHYSGVVLLGELLPRTIRNEYAIQECYDTDGNFLLNAIKIYVKSGAGAKENAVTFHKMNLVSRRMNPVIAGDITDDGFVNIKDITRLVYYLNGKDSLTEEEQSIADYNADNKVNLRDAMTLFYIANGLL